MKWKKMIYKIFFNTISKKIFIYINIKMDQKHLNQIFNDEKKGLKIYIEKIEIFNVNKRE